MSNYSPLDKREKKIRGEIHELPRSLAVGNSSCDYDGNDAADPAWIPECRYGLNSTMAFGGRFAQRRRFDYLHLVRHVLFGRVELGLKGWRDKRRC